MYHPNDQEAAINVCEIVNEAGFQMQKSIDTSLEKDLLDLVSSTDCVISVITNNKWELDCKVFERYKHRFVTVLWNITHSTIDEEKDYEFFRGCKNVQCDDVQFRASLMFAIKSTAKQSVCQSQPSEPVQGLLATGVQRQPSVVIQTCEPGLMTIYSDCTVAPVQTDDVSKNCASDSSHGILSQFQPSRTPRYTSDSAAGHSQLQPETSRIYSNVTLRQTIKDGQFGHVEFTQSVTDKYKNFVRTMKRQRSPWLVPILKILDKPLYRIKFTCIHASMEGGSLETHLCEMQDVDLGNREWLITIAYQISAGIKFLHERNIVHGDITPQNIRFDQHGIVRLADYGMYSHKSAQSYIFTRNMDAVSPKINSKLCFISDLHSFAGIILRLLKPSISDEEFDSSLNTLLHNVDHSRTEILVESEIWPNDDITLNTKQVLQCHQNECNRTTASELNRTLQTIMKSFKPALPLTRSVDLNPVCLSRGMDKHTSCLDPAACTSLRCCLYCSMLPVHPELKLRSTHCPESCLYLCACISCMQKFGSHCHVENDVCDHSPKLNSGYVSNICPNHECTLLMPSVSQGIVIKWTFSNGICIILQ